MTHEEPEIRLPTSALDELRRAHTTLQVVADLMTPTRHSSDLALVNRERLATLLNDISESIGKALEAPTTCR